MLVAVASSANTWTYTQNADFTGTDTFSFVVIDNDGRQSEPGVVMVGQPRLVSGELDFRSYPGIAAANPQVRIVNVDIYADPATNRFTDTCAQVPPGSGMFQCHGDRTSETFIASLAASSRPNTYHYHRLFTEIQHSLNGNTLFINTNMNTIVTDKLKAKSVFPGR